MMKAENAIDIISSMIPYGDTIGSVIKTWWDKKLTESREIYVSEVRDGIFDNIDTDDMISICHRLWRAMSEGTAKNNFRLLCRLVQGLGDNKQLTAPNFLKFTSILESLTEQEIKIIAYDLWKKQNPQPHLYTGGRVEQFISILGKTVPVRADTEEEIELQKQRYEEWKQTKDRMLTDIGTSYSQGHRFEPNNNLYYALLRTGLYSMSIRTETETKVYEDGSGAQSESGSATYFGFTGLMNELIKYVDFTINYNKGDSKW